MDYFNEASTFCRQSFSNFVSVTSSFLFNTIMENEQHLSFWSEVSEPLSGDSALHRVVQRNDVDSIAEIVKTVFVNILNNRWESPLITAAQSGRHACITALLGHGARVDQQDRHGNTAIHYVALQHHMKAAEALIAANADCNIMNCEGKTTIHFLVYNSNITMISYIVGKRPIELDITNGDQCRPFLYALKRGCNRLVRYFLSIGYDLTIQHADGNFSLHVAIQCFDPVILRAVTKNFSINNKNNDGHSPVALAVLFNNDAALDIVWRRNADRDIVDNNGDTLVHLVCRGWSYTIVKHIAYHQRNVNARNEKSQTPLHVACEVGHPTVISALRPYFPDLTLQDREFRNPLIVTIFLGPSGQSNALTRMVQSKFTTPPQSEG